MTTKDSVIRFIEQEITNSDRLADQFLTKVENIQKEIYSDSYGTLIDVLSDLGEEDSWWLEILWNEVKARKEIPDDEKIGFIIRTYIERKILQISRVQVEEDTINEPL